jgi:hypothetical protein
MTKWNKKKEASTWWLVIGLLGGLGYLIALIYVLASENKKRIWSLFYLLGIIGAVVLYFVFRDKDRQFSDLSVKLIIGNIIIGVVLLVFFVVAFALFGVSFWHQMMYGSFTYP